MNDPLERQIADFYRRQTPSERVRRALLDAASTDAPRASANARPRAFLWTGIAAGLAASFILGYALGSGPPRRADRFTSVRDVAEEKVRPPAMRPGRVTADEIARSSESTDPADLRGKPALATIPFIAEEGVESPAPSDLARPRLILIQVSADWCPRSPTVRPMFDELARRHAGESILLVTFNVTAPADRRQAAYLAHSIGVLEILGHKWEPGMIQLIDTQAGEIIESLRTADEMQRFETTLAALLVPRR